MLSSWLLLILAGLAACMSGAIKASQLLRGKVGMADGCMRSRIGIEEARDAYACLTEAGKL
jgi:hypothetical protein